MRIMLFNILLALAWAAVTGAFSFLNLVFGFVLGGIVLGLIREQAGSVTHFRRAGRAVLLAVIFVYELIKASINVAIIVLSPWRRLQPAIIAYPLTVQHDMAITLLANMITLTPGTLSIDVSDDRSTLFVHAIDAPDIEAVIADIKSCFEVRIIQLFEPGARDER